MKFLEKSKVTLLLSLVLILTAISIFSIVVAVLNVYQIVPHNCITFLLSLIICVFLILIGIKCESKTLPERENSKNINPFIFIMSSFIIVNFILFIFTNLFVIQIMFYLYNIISFIVTMVIPLLTGIIIVLLTTHIEHPEYYEHSDKNSAEIGDKVEW